MKTKTKRFHSGSMLTDDALDSLKTFEHRRHDETSSRWCLVVPKDGEVNRAEETRYTKPFSETEIFVGNGKYLKIFDWAEIPEGVSLRKAIACVTKAGFWMLYLPKGYTPQDLSVKGRK